MKKALLAILALGFICNASAYSWRLPFINAERDNIIYNINKQNCKNYSDLLRKCLD